MESCKPEIIDINETICGDIVYVTIVKEDINRYAVSSKEKRKMLKERTVDILKKYKKIPNIDKNENYKKLLYELDRI